MQQKIEMMMKQQVKTKQVLSMTGLKQVHQIRLEDMIGGAEKGIESGI